MRAALCAQCGSFLSFFHYPVPLPRVGSRVGGSQLTLSSSSFVPTYFRTWASLHILPLFRVNKDDTRNISEVSKTQEFSPIKLSFQGIPLHSMQQSPHFSLPPNKVPASHQLHLKHQLLQPQGQFVQEHTLPAFAVADQAVAADAVARSTEPAAAPAIAAVAAVAAAPLLSALLALELAAAAAPLLSALLALELAAAAPLLSALLALELAAAAAAVEHAVEPALLPAAAAAAVGLALLPAAAALAAVLHHACPERHNRAEQWHNALLAKWHNALLARWVLTPIQYTKDFKPCFICGSTRIQIVSMLLGNKLSSFVP
eukprot:1158383-Pelagomonas_calceolata.AAC.4